MGDFQGMQDTIQGAQNDRKEPVVEISGKKLLD